MPRTRGLLQKKSSYTDCGNRYRLRRAPGFLSRRPVYRGDPSTLILGSIGSGKSFLVNFLTASDFEGMDQPDILEPLLFYILHRANASIYDREQAAIPKLFVFDEAWRFFRNPTTRAYIVEALKTWRKRNAAMVLATQSSDDLLKEEMLSVIAESCFTKFFLANPGMDSAVYRETFHLNDTEASMIARLVPKQRFLLKRPDLAKVLNLNVDDHALRIFGNARTPPETPTPYDHQNAPHSRAQRDGIAVR